ncbi:MAG: glycosyltransferase [Marinilabiliales bacterium]
MNTGKFNTQKINPDFYISILVPVRNEEKNLPNIIKSFEKLEFDPNKFEIIFIDDNSEDSGIQIIESAQKKLINICLLKSKGTGKKDALKTGIEKSKGELIITIDADCTFDKNWLLSIASYYHKYKSDLIIGPVKLESHDFFGTLQQLEFTALSVATCGSAAIGNAVMCNGANLAFKKEVYNDINTKTGYNYASGDDIFLLTEIKKKNKTKIHYLKSKGAIVYTNAINSFSGFWNQRKRWTSKNKAIKDLFIVFTGLIVYLTNLLILITGMMLIFKQELLLIFLVSFGIKTLVDFISIYIGSGFFELRRKAWIALILEPVNIFYTVVTGIAGLTSGFVWKNRRYK